MIDFLIKSTICLVILLGFYHLVLEREKMHRFNRFYLLFSIVISLVLPFVTFEIIKEIPVEKIAEPIFMPIPISDELVAEPINYTPIVLWGLYGLTTLALVFRFGKNIWKLTSKSRSNPIVKYRNARLVLVEEKTIPHTFLNSIFINFDDYNQRNIEDELYTHELVHVTQKHTLDILFVEFLKTVFWFNPIFYFYKKAIQLNHEFLADEKVVESYNDVPFYQSLLLQKGNGNQTIYLASNLNYLVTKKRLIMMTKNTSKKLALLKKIAIVPVMIGLIYFFCIEIVAQEKVINPKATSTGKTITNEDKIRDSYYSNVRIILKDLRNGTTIDKMYEELSLEEKRTYLGWVPDMIIEKEIPEPLFQKMKTKNMAVWINGKTSSAAEIQKYNRTDFSYYTYSFVHKNARTKRFPQEYQYTLYTKKYFEDNLKNSHLHFENDTLKLVVSDYKKNKVDEILSKTNPDTIVWQTKEKEIYNIYIKDSVKKKVDLPKKALEKAATITEVPTKKQESDLYNVAELSEKPEFELGIAAFYKYIAANFKIPEEVTKNKLKGRVFASFIVEKDGSLSNIKILREMGYGTGEEAERVLKESPKWKPGKVNGNPVRTMYSLPISIASE